MVTAYRDCFLCDTSSGFASAEACTERGPEHPDMNSVRMPNTDECYLCYKRVASKSVWFVETFGQHDCEHGFSCMQLDE